MGLSFLSRWSDQFLAVMRIMTALLFMQHGTTKLFQFPVDPTAPAGHGPAFLSLIWIAGFMEVVGGALMVAGLWTRYVAFLCSGEMAVAYFYTHASRSFYPILNHGDEAILYCFIFLYLAAAGGGAWGLDSVFAKGRSMAPASAE